MVRVTRAFLLLVLGITLPIGSEAQETPAVVEIVSNAKDADVYVDGSFAGPVGQRRFNVFPESRELRLVLGGGYSWSVPPLSRGLDSVVAGDTIRITMDFPYYYRLESTPADAIVSLNTGPDSTHLGRTPTTLETPDPLKGTLVFTLDGFESVTIVPGGQIWNLHSVDLQSLDTNHDPARLALTPPAARRRWIDYAAVGTALVAGALAVHFKFEADRRFDRYQQTGDPALRPGIKRYDVYSGVALGFMQAGIGVFAIRLVLR